jgi:FkbM family methyltransferase
MKKKPLVILAVLTLLIGILGLWHEPLFLVGLGIIKGSPCPLAEMGRAIDNERKPHAIADAYAKQSRMIEKDPAGYVLWDTPKGRWWIPNKSEGALFLDLAEQSQDIYGHDVRRGDIVLDAGANIGVYTRKVLDAGAKLVIAIEPAPENLECLRRNFKGEIAAGQVVVYAKGIWDKEDVLSFNIDPDNSAADSFVIRRTNAKNVLQLPVTTVDKMMAELKLERADFIKMDIEGAEPRALAGAKETLAKYKPRMAICVYHAKTDRDSVPAAIRAARADYQQECAKCQLGDGSIWPTVMYFR